MTRSVLSGEWLCFSWPASLAAGAQMEPLGSLVDQIECRSCTSGSHAACLRVAFRRSTIAGTAKRSDPRRTGCR
jgi:hypothetical protein